LKQQWYLPILVAALVLSFCSTVVVAQVPPADPAEESADPPGAFDTAQVGPVATLAQKLSLDRTWLTEDILSKLEETTVPLEEILPGSTSVFLEDDYIYITRVEKVGALWADFNPDSDPYFVFLTHEVYTGLGEDRALAFQDGIQTEVFLEDFDLLPALALTIERVPLDTAIDFVETASDPDNLPIEPICRSTSDTSSGSNDPDHLIIDPDCEPDPTPTKLCPNSGTSCPQYAPTACSQGSPVCPTGSNPYFVLRRLLIKEDHEGLFKGNPEIELHPLNIEALPQGSGTSPYTRFVFSGRRICDAVGQERFLPDINDENAWYSFEHVALYPAKVGEDWALTLVEDDEGLLGTINKSGSTANTIYVFRSTSSISALTRSLSSLNFVVGNTSLFRASFPGGDDDLYQPSIGVTNDLFCNSGLNHAFPRVFSLNTPE